MRRVVSIGLLWFAAAAGPQAVLATGPGTARAAGAAAPAGVAALLSSRAYMLRARGFSYLSLVALYQSRSAGVGGEWRLLGTISSRDLVHAGRPLRYMSREVLVSASGARSSRRVVRVGRVGASRSGRSSWECHILPRSGPLRFLDEGALDPAEFASPKPRRLRQFAARIVSVRPSGLGGRPTWAVAADLSGRSFRAFFGGPGRWAGTYQLLRRDDAMVALKASWTFAAGRASDASRTEEALRVSRYGRLPRATLPSRCRGLR